MEELVCNESRRPFTWYFNPKGRVYSQRSADGKLQGNINGVNIPNPLDIAEARTRAIKRGQLPIGSRIEADPITKQLWEHWKCQI